MSAPSNLPPVRRPRPSGVHHERRPWWGKPDAMCVLAIILAIAGVFPHAVEAVNSLVRTLRGLPVASVTQTSQTSDASGQGGKK